MVIPKAPKGKARESGLPGHATAGNNFDWCPGLESNQHGLAANGF